MKLSLMNFSPKTDQKNGIVCGSMTISKEATAISVFVFYLTDDNPAESR